MEAERAELEPMTREPQSRRFDTGDGIELHCLHWSTVAGGDDPARAPIILLHGAGANAHWWDHVVDRLDPNRDVYALDFRGHGDSSFPEERFVGAFNTDLEATMAWVGREDVHLVGHSMGAAVALDHASRFPRTRSLVLVDLARGGPPGGGRRARLALAHRRTYKTREDAMDRFQFLPEPGRPDESIRRYIAERSIRAEPNGRFGFKFDPAWFSLPARPRPDLDRISCPTLLVRGGESRLLSIEAAREFVSQIAIGRLIEIPGAGHHVLIDEPARLSKALGDWIDELEGSGRPSTDS